MAKDEKKVVDDILKFLKLYRLKNNLSVREMSIKLDVSDTTVKKLEKGIHPGSKVFTKISCFYLREKM